MNAILLLSFAFAGLDYSTALVTERGGDPIVVTPQDADAGAAGVEPPSDAAPVSTTVCRCQGYKKRDCLCLKAGVKCHCTRTSGSVWAPDSQGVLHKTGAKADPRLSTKQTASVDKTGSYDVTSRNGRAEWTDSTGRLWYTGANRLSEGVVYGGRFTYRNGKMHESSTMAADIAPKGHYELQKQCVGGVCRMYRVWVPE